MMRLVLNNKKRFNKKGFTLVELLAVIVILAIIMLIAIPTVLSTMEATKRKSFDTYVDKIQTVAQQEILKKEFNGEHLGQECTIFDITKDFDLNNTGDYKGYILIQVTESTTKSYITMWNNDYMLISYNITDKINYKGKNKALQDSLERYDESRSDELTIQSLCNYACNSCSYKTGELNDDGSQKTETISGDFSKIKGATILKTGGQVNSIFNTISDGRANILKIKKAESLDETKEKQVISSDEGTSVDNPVYVWFDSGILYFYTDATAIFLNANSSSLLANMNNVVELDDFIENTYADNVTNTAKMFAYDVGLKKIDLSKWKLNKVTNISEMFAGCLNVEELNISNLNVSNVTSLNNTFGECQSLKELDVSKWDTSKVTDMRNTFKGCKTLKTIDVSNWNLSRVDRIDGMFNNCQNLETLNVSKWDTSSVKFMGDVNTTRGTFYNCYKLNGLDVSNWNTSKVKYFTYTFGNCHALTSLNVSNWNVSSARDFSYMFYEANSLSNLDVSNWKTNLVENMEGMFCKTSALTSLNVSKWNVGNVTNMTNMFFKSAIKNIDFSSWTNNVITNIEGMFGHSVIESVNLNGFNTQNVTSFKYLFYYSNLKSIDISSWNNSSVENYYNMFAGSSQLEHVYVGNNWNSSNYENKEATTMFFNNVKIHNWDGTQDYTKAHVGSDGYFEKK